MMVKNLNFEEGFINSLTIKTRKFPNPNFEEPIKAYYNWIKNWNEVENTKKILKRSGMRDTMKTQKSLLKKFLTLPILTSLMKKKLKIN